MSAYKAMYATLCGAIDNVLDSLNQIPQAKAQAMYLQQALLQAEELDIENTDACEQH